MRIPFLGPSNPLDPGNADLERSVNVYPELTGPGAPKVRATLRHTPGRHVACVIAGAASVDTLFTDGSATPGVSPSTFGRLFFVAGTVFGELVFTGTSTISQVIWGTVGASVAPGQQSTIASNGDSGHQLFIVSGGNGYIFDLQTNNFGLITDADFPNGSAACGVYLDGYFIVLNYTDSTFQLSALANGTSWDALDVAQLSDASDRITTLAVYRNELWLIGALTSQVWYDSGNASFPFTPVQGSLMQIGSVYPWTVQVLDNALWFTGQEHSQGRPVVYRATDYNPAIVSTVALANKIAATDTSVDVLRAWTYEDLQHSFYVLRLPTGSTWAYDQATQVWHERGLYNSGSGEYDPDPVKCHAFQFGVHLVGDHDTGTIWTMSNDYYADQVAS